MAIMLIASAILASNPPAPPQALSPRAAAALPMCEAGIKRRGYSDIESPTIAPAGRSGRDDRYRGTFERQVRATAGGAGELTPHHVQLVTYTFTCVLRGSHVRRLAIREQ